jgi:hypothetical protein
MPKPKLIAVNPRVVALVPDLMDRSKVEAAARAAGVHLEMVSGAAELGSAAGKADLVIVDLGRPGVLDALGSLAQVRTVGFGSHVERDLLRAAADAGCSQVMARSAFFGRLGDLFGGLAGAGGAQAGGAQAGGAQAGGAQAGGAQAGAVAPSADISSSEVMGSENIKKS